MSLDNIPQEQRDNFPAGVSEVEYKTEAEIDAFRDGLHYADDIDVENSKVFQRDGMFVCRIRVGEWDDDQIEDEAEVDEETT